MKKRVLITGANGFAGRNLMNALPDEEYEKIPLVRKTSGLKDEIVADFCDVNFSLIVNSLVKVDAVVHFGAKIGFGNSSKKDFFLPNVLATAELVNWANKVGAHFVFASTAIVCGVKNPFISSQSKPDPDTHYGYSKWLAEELIKMSEVSYTILRIGGIFGRNGSPYLSINEVINDALNGIKPKQYGSGDIRRSYIYVKDLSEIIKKCMENKLEGTYFAAGSNVNTISEMLNIICDILLPGSEPEYEVGIDGQDQIVEHSLELRKGRSFKKAIENIKNDEMKGLI